MFGNPNLGAMLRHRPTEIRPSIKEYLSPGRRREIFTTGYAYPTNWTKSMLRRLKTLDNSGLTDNDILATLKKEYGGPDVVEEIWQERAFLATGSRRDGTWSTKMEDLVIEMANSGNTVMEITTELHRLYKRPGAWAETYRKIQQLTLKGWIEKTATTPPVTSPTEVDDDKEEEEPKDTSGEQSGNEDSTAKESPPPGAEAGDGVATT
ncbi:MAG: hypothetical protein Q9168_003870 [Polycauliona sp. 1 TL-2023]